MLEVVTYELNAVGRTPFACLVVILERDHEALERAQRRSPVMRMSGPQSTACTQ
jgi:hypothetical protein